MLSYLPRKDRLGAHILVYRVLSYNTHKHSTTTRTIGGSSMSATDCTNSSIQSSVYQYIEVAFCATPIMYWMSRLASPLRR